MPFILWRTLNAMAEIVSIFLVNVRSVGRSVRHAVAVSEGILDPVLGSAQIVHAVGDLVGRGMAMIPATHLTTNPCIRMDSALEFQRRKRRWEPPRRAAGSVSSVRTDSFCPVDGHGLCRGRLAAAVTRPRFGEFAGSNLPR